MSRHALFTVQEFNPHNYPMSPEVADNLDSLLWKMVHARVHYGRSMILTSGLRSASEQMEFIRTGRSNAPKSKHLIGQACDVADSDRSLARWVRENEKILESIGLWCEDPACTPGWVHFQGMPPLSGRRLFIP